MGRDTPVSPDCTPPTAEAVRAGFVSVQPNRRVSSRFAPVARGGERMGSTALAVVIPAGPADDVADTVASVVHFTSPPRFIVVVDDTGHAVQETLEALSSDVHVIPAPAKAPGAHGGLWVKLAAGYRHILDNFSFDVILRLDADALVIGNGIAKSASERFASDSRLGMLGSYRLGYDGGTRNWEPAARILDRECGLRGMDRPRMRQLLRTLRSIAVENGYVGGEHPLGGAYLHSRSAVHAIAERGWLSLSPLRQSHLGEDHIFALLTHAAGFEIGDSAGPDDPMALDWKGLPAAPAELLARHKVVTHSVRFWGDLREAEIRATFANARRRLPTTNDRDPGLGGRKN